MRFFYLCYTWCYGWVDLDSLILGIRCLKLVNEVCYKYWKKKKRKSVIFRRIEINFYRGMVWRLSRFYRVKLDFILCFYSYFEVWYLGGV